MLQGRPVLSCCGEGCGDGWYHREAQIDFTVPALVATSTSSTPLCCASGYLPCSTGRPPRPTTLLKSVHSPAAHSTAARRGWSRDGRGTRNGLRRAFCRNRCDATAPWNAKTGTAHVRWLDLVVRVRWPFGSASRRRKSPNSKPASFPRPQMERGSAASMAATVSARPYAPTRLSLHPSPPTPP